MGKDVRIKGRRVNREWAAEEVVKLMKGKTDAYLLYVGAPRGPLHAGGRSTQEAAPRRRPLHAGVAVF